MACALERLRMLNSTGFIGVLVLVGIGCGTGNVSRESVGSMQMYVHQGETQGTTYTIKYHGDAEISQAAIDSVLDAVDQEFNLWLPQSRINQINGFDSVDSLFEFDDEHQLWSVIWARSLDLHEASHGAFDPTVQPLVELWGFGLQKADAVTEDAVKAILPHVGMTTDRIDLIEEEINFEYIRSFIRKGDARVGLDFNSIAQGLTVDLLADLLERSGNTNFMVEIGGEVKCGGVRLDGGSWRIAIDQPVEGSGTESDRPMAAIVNVHNAAICTSGNYRKFYEMDGIKRSHTISPFTGYPVQHGLLSATIHAVDATTADALATACMVWGPIEGRNFIENYRSENPFEKVEAYFIMSTDQGTMASWESEGWKALKASDSPAMSH